ncbi:MAG: hypothetical protein V4552_08200 [Pseudomonadota bacterium]
MIETFQQAEIPFIFDADGAKLWSFAHMNLIIPWFFVHYVINVEGQIVSCQIMLFNIGQIEQLIIDPTISIKAIYLISPGYLNQTNKWSMDLIKSLSTGIDEKSFLEQSVTRYELANYKFYYYPEITSQASFKKIADIYVH